jgi:hypothetical protein
MKSFVLAAAALAVVSAAAIASASAANITQPPPGTPIYGPLAATPPAGEAPPTRAPAGYHYVWVYSYDHHGYRAHWEAERNS